MTTEPNPTAWASLDRHGKGELIRPYIEDLKLSYSQIGKILGVSRVAIAGAADRNRIKSPFSRGVQPKGAQGPAAQAARKRLIDGKPPKPGKQPTRPHVKPPTPDLPLAPAWLPLPGTTPRPLEQHRTGECLWPVGQNPTLFCCADVKDDGNWCPTHRALGYKPRQPPAFNGRKHA